MKRIRIRLSAPGWSFKFTMIGDCDVRDALLKNVDLGKLNIKEMYDFFQSAFEDRVVEVGKHKEKVSDSCEVILDVNTWDIDNNHLKLQIMTQNGNWRTIAKRSFNVRNLKICDNRNPQMDPYSVL